MEASEKMPNIEIDNSPDYKVDKIAPEGLGFGEGTISVDTRIEDPNDSLTQDVMDKVDGIITEGQILVHIESDDDGCGDGRPAGLIMQGLKLIEKSYNRAKTFGGGLTMGVAARIGLGKAGKGLKQLFHDESDDFRSAGLNYGAHTGKHKHGANCGCGAIDGAPNIVANVSKYHQQISTVLDMLKPILHGHGVEADDGYRESVIDNFVKYYNSRPNENYSGKAVMEDVVLEDEKVVKELEEDHYEVAIVINTVEGYTVDQDLIRSATENVAQVFAVDLPRKITIAANRYGEPEERSKAVISMLVYTLSTAATLTDGSLPVYIITPENAEMKISEPEPVLV